MHSRAYIPLNFLCGSSCACRRRAGALPLLPVLRLRLLPAAAAQSADQPDAGRDEQIQRRKHLQVEVLEQIQRGEKQQKIRNAARDPVRFRIGGAFSIKIQARNGEHQQVVPVGDLGKIQERTAQEHGIAPVKVLPAADEESHDGGKQQERRVQGHADDAHRRGNVGAEQPDRRNDPAQNAVKGDVARALVPPVHAVESDDALQKCQDRLPISAAETCQRQKDEDDGVERRLEKIEIPPLLDEQQREHRGVQFEGDGEREKEQRKLAQHPLFAVIPGEKQEDARHCGEKHVPPAEAVQHGPAEEDGEHRPERQPAPLLDKLPDRKTEKRRGEHKIQKVCADEIGVFIGVLQGDPAAKVGLHRAAAQEREGIGEQDRKGRIVGIERAHAAVRIPAQRKRHRLQKIRKTAPAEHRARVDVQKEQKKRYGKTEHVDGGENEHKDARLIQL